MPGHCWGSSDQVEFLNDHLPDFQDAQRKKTTPAFWVEIHREFFKRWPDPDAEVPAATVPRKPRTKKGKVLSEPVRKEYASVADWTEARKTQIINWFNNRGVNGKRGVSSAPVFHLGGSDTRVSSELQIYSRMYYETRVKVKADLALTGIQDNSVRLKIINKCTAETWETEDDTIKAAVRHEREAEVEDKKERKKKGINLSGTPEQYARELLTLPSSVKAFCEEMQLRTGWSFTVLCGGPEPANNGRLRTIAIHVGIDRFGQIFSKAQGEFHEKFINPFSAFLQNVYSPDECNQRSINNDIKNVKHGHQDPSGETIGGGEEAIESSVVAPQLPASPQQHLSVISASPADQITVPSKGVPAQHPLPPGPGPLLLADIPQQNPTPKKDGPAAANTPHPLPQNPTSDATASASANTSDPVLLTYQPQYDLAAKANAPALVNSQYANPLPVPHQPMVESQSAPINSSLIPELGSPSTPLIPQISYSAPAPAITAIQRHLIDQSQSQTNSVSRSDSIPNGWGAPIQPMFEGGGSYSSLVGEWDFSRMDEQFSFTNYLNSGMIDGSNEPVFQVNSVEAKSDDRNGLYLPDDIRNAAYSPLPLNEHTFGLASIKPHDTTVPENAFSPPTFKANLKEPCPDPPSSSSPVPEATQSNDSMVILGASLGGVMSNESILQPITAPQNGLSQPSLLPLIPEASQSNNTAAVLGASFGMEKESEGLDRMSRIRRPATSKEVPTMWRDAAHAYFCQGLDHDEWKRCVDLWLQFEKQEESDFETNSYRMSAKERPSQLTKWICTRKYGNIPEIVDVDMFANEWVRWWNSVQPKWRQNATGDGLPLALSNGKLKDDLLALKKGGPSGIVTILIGLKWWASISERDLRWKLAVEDMTACFSAFIAGLGGKRKTGPGTENKAGRKKQKTF